MFKKHKGAKNKVCKEKRDKKIAYAIQREHMELSYGIYRK
jgi:hypothetical protein